MDCTVILTNVTKVLMVDGWHNVSDGSFEYTGVKYAPLGGNVWQDGNDAALVAGFSFKSSDRETISGQRNAILAVAYGDKSMKPKTEEEKKAEKEAEKAQKEAEKEADKASKKHEDDEDDGPRAIGESADSENPPVNPDGGMQRIGPVPTPNDKAPDADPNAVTPPNTPEQRAASRKAKADPVVNGPTLGTRIM